jgi:hypothetical protein
VEDLIKICWRQSNYYHMDSKGVAGGLAILWNPTIVIMDQALSMTRTITTHYQAIGSNKDGMITNAYGPQSGQGKDLFLRILSYLGLIVGQKCWIIKGDLNIILTLEEKIGGKKHLEQDNSKL